MVCVSSLLSKYGLPRLYFFNFINSSFFSSYLFVRVLESILRRILKKQIQLEN